MMDKAMNNEPILQRHTICSFFSERLKIGRQKFSVL